MQHNNRYNRHITPRGFIDEDDEAIEKNPFLNGKKEYRVETPQLNHFEIED